MKIKLSFIIVGIIIVLVLVGLAFYLQPTAVAQGTLVLKITDKIELTNITSIDITISKVEVHKAGAGEKVNETNETIETNETTTAGWETIVEESKTFDLIEITGIEEFLGEKTLPTGKYTQIRLEVTDAKITVEDTENDLKIPSKKFKLIHPFDIEANKTTTLVLDFDASESVVKAGQKYILKPVVKIIEK